MDNFDYKKFLAEGKLNEETEALDRESVIDFAQMVADAFTQEDVNDAAMIYTVGKVDGLEFELDTQATENTPADDAKYGTGEGWGGSFRIEVLPNGYEIRNSEKGGLVATMDMEDGFRMLSADESRAELEGEPDVDWKNDELDMKRMEEGEEVAEAQEEVAEYSSKMKKSELKEMIRAAFLNEAEGDEEDIENEIEVDDVDVDVDADIDMDMDVDSGEDGINVKQDADAELGGTVGDVQDNLEAALEAARKLGDEKLEDQIGNTLTFFTRQHVVKEGDMIEDEAEMGLEEIKNSPELDKAKEDYMAGKISLADYQAIVKKLDFKGVKDAEAKAQAKADAIAAEKKELEDKKAKVKQAEEDRKAGKISQEEFAKIAQANQYVNKESLNEEISRMQKIAGIKK